MPIQQKNKPNPAIALGDNLQYCTRYGIYNYPFEPLIPVCFRNILYANPISNRDDDTITKYPPDKIISIQGDPYDRNNWQVEEFE